MTEDHHGRGGRLEALILTRETDEARRLADALASFHISAIATDSSLDRAADVVLTDFEHDALAAKWRRNLEDAGILTLAPAGWGDATLAADFTPRELELACTLAVKIGRLRRQRNELTRTRDQITQLAETDPLTGLPNRRLWQRRLATAGEAASPRHHLWLALVDLDNFKATNDRLGMAAGDAVLVRAGRALAGQLRRDDLVARLGGDEFGLLLDGIPPAHVAGVIDRLREAIAQQAEVSASIGYVALDAKRDVEELMTLAERAMRGAKRAGGNRIQEAE